MSEIKVCATGDSFMTRMLPEDYPDFAEIQALIASANLRFNNLEFTAHNQEGAPAAVSGGTWAMSRPEILDDLHKFGFNIYNTANNHALDYGEGGCLATLKHMDERGMLHCGTGASLKEASAPCFAEDGGHSFAVIGACATYNVASPAGDPSSKVRGRAGLNPLAHKKIFHVNESEFNVLKQIAEKTHINATMNYDIANGYRKPLPEGSFSLENIAFKLDTDTFTVSKAGKGDVKRIIAAIEEAKKKAEYVFVSVHSHSYDGEDPAEAPQFMKDFAHQIIDAGADGLLGHGPHIMQGIEVYKNKPIFYSLGDFIFQTETVELQPAEAYTKMGLPAESEVKTLMLQRSNNDTTGYAAIPDIWRSVIANFTMEDGVTKEIRLEPISLGMGQPWEKRGWPHLSKDSATLEHLAELSKPFGTEIEIKDGTGFVKL